MNQSSFEELIDDLSDYKGYGNSEDLSQEELRDLLTISSEFIAFMDDKIYSDSKYVLFKMTLSDLALGKDTSEGYRRALGMARRYSETDKLPNIIKPEMVKFSVEYAISLQKELDYFAIESKVIDPSENHFNLFKEVLEEKQKKLSRPRLYAISIHIDSQLAVDREYIVSTTPIEALSKLDFANKIGPRPENIKIEIVKITDVTA